MSAEGSVALSVNQSFKDSQSADSEDEDSVEFRDDDDWDDEVELEYEASLDPIKAARKRLNLSTGLKRFVGREKETQQIEELLLSAFTNSKPASIYISGVPGCGKTASVTSLLRRLEEKHEFFSIYAHSVAESGFIRSICARLTEELGPSLQKSFREKLRDLVTRSGSQVGRMNNSGFVGCSASLGRGCVVILVDEVDQLSEADLRELYALPVLSNSCATVVGIANTLSLTDKLFSKVRALEAPPVQIHFAAYSKAQIVNILNQRLAATKFLFSAEALQLIAAKVTEQQGDIRRALELALKALDRAVERTAGSADVVVKIPDVADVLRKVLPSSTIDRVKSLTLHLQLMLAALVLLIRGPHHTVDCSVSEFHARYKSLCRILKLPCIIKNDFVDNCANLKDSQLIEVSSARTIDEAKTKRQRTESVSMKHGVVSLLPTVPEVCEALKTNSMIARLLDEYNEAV